MSIVGIVISIILVIGSIIFFHELGHLIVAKRSGILCREFAIGFGPKLFSYKKGETLYTFRLLPLGGYVRMAGEDPEIVQVKTGHEVKLLLNEKQEVVKIILDNKKQYPDALPITIQKMVLERDLFIEGYDQADLSDETMRYDVHPQAVLVHKLQETQIAPVERQFGSKTVGKKAATIFAGPLANFILAFVLLIFSAAYFGLPTNMIGEVLSESAAEEAGLQSGDRIIAADGQEVNTWGDIVRTISGHQMNQEIRFVIQRDGIQLQIPVTPKLVEQETGEMTPMIGITGAREQQLTGAVSYGFNTTIDYAQLIFTALSMLVQGGVTLDDVAGPAGIIDITGQIAQRGLYQLIHWTALLSINVGIMNLLPIPALDGGRLLFIGVEAVRGRPIDPQKEGIVHFIGFALLMMLILLVTWNDIQRIFFN
jgi:regulator of sigma E protease